MTAYATSAQFLQWQHDVDYDLADVDALLERASRDVDSYLAWPAPVTTGLRIDPTTLSAFQADCLTQATVRQACYRLTVGEEDLAEGQPRVVSVGQVGLATTPPDRIGPDVLVILQAAGLLRRSGCAAPPPDPVPDPWDPWWDDWWPDAA